LSVFAFATALLVVLAWRFASNRAKVRRAKEQAQAHWLEARLFRYPLGVFARACGRLLRAALAWAGRSLAPLALVALPIALLVGQLDMRYACRPLLPREPALLVVHTGDAASTSAVSVDFPEGLVSAGPLARLPAEKAVGARFESWQVGQTEIMVRAGAAEFIKEVITGTGFPRLSARRVRGGWWTHLRFPGEAGLPATGPVSSIVLEYPRRTLWIEGIRVHWLLWYCVVALAAVLVLRPIVGVEW